MTAPAQDMSEETLAAIKKAQTAGVTEATGLYSYDLSELINLIPVVTPFRDLVSRKKVTDGNPYAVWRAFMNATNNQPDPSVGFDYAGAEMVFNLQNFQATYKPTSMAVNVTQDSFDLAQGYSDPYADATFQTLNQVLIGDDRKELCAQSFALKAATAPTLTQVTTGGTIPASTTVYVGVAGRTGSGYFYGSGNSQGASTSGASGGGTATNSVTATTAAQRGAVAYDWFQSANGTVWYYYGTTTVNTITMTSVITSNNPVSSGTTVPDLRPTGRASWPRPAATPAPPTTGRRTTARRTPTTTTASSRACAATTTAVGQWVQPGTATANPSVWNSLNGAALTLTGGSDHRDRDEYIFVAALEPGEVQPRPPSW